MNIIAIIQARMGSSRLPGKVLKSLGNSDVLTYVIERCRKIEGIKEVIVATSQLKQDDAIVNWCKGHGVNHYRGSEQNVLSRYIEAAEPYQPDYVMRVTSDCPFVDYELASDMIQQLQENPVEIIDITQTLPRGLAVEIISYEALKRIANSELAERHREHVTYYAYEYKERFTRVAYTPPREIQHEELRITLDTDEDYTLCQAIANHFNNLLVSSTDVVSYLMAHPEIANLNAHIEQKPVI